MSLQPPRPVEENLVRWSPIELCSLFFVITGLLTVGSLVIGVFQPFIILALSVLSAALVLWWRGFRAPRVSLSTGLALVGILLVAVLVRVEPFGYVYGGQDQGIYYNMGAWAQHHGSLAITDPARAALDKELGAVLDSHELQVQNPPVKPGQFEGSHLPGIYFKDKKKGDLVFQFYPLFPGLLALGGAIFGDTNRTWMLVVLSVVGIYYAMVLVRDLIGPGRRWIVQVVGLLLATNGLNVFLSRFPVTENVSLLFSLLGLVHLFRWMRSGTAMGSRDGILSLLAFACLFLNHIAGFFWAALVTVFLLYAIVRATDSRIAKRLAVWAGLFGVLWWLSYLYGMVFSFPYTHDIYYGTFGPTLGRLVIDQAPLFTTLFFIGLVAVLAGAVALRPYVKWSGFDRPSALVTRSVWLALGGVMILVLALGTWVAYRLAYTSAYDHDAFAATIYHLNQSGLRGVLHSSWAVFILNVGPAVLVFLVSAPFWFSNRPDRYRVMAIVIFLVFLFLRTVPNDVTYYYYYSRYLGSELVPYALVCLGLFLGETKDWTSRLKTAALAGVFVCTLVGNGYLLTLQRQGSELAGTEKGLGAIAQAVGPGNLLIFEGVGASDSAVRTAFSFTFGITTLELTSEEIRQNTELLRKHWANIYVVTPQFQEESAKFVGGFQVLGSRYARGKTDIVPKGSVQWVDTFYVSRL